MTDVYNKTVFERNSVQDVPQGFIDAASENLIRFLGSFWRNIHEGREFVRGLQRVRGIKAAQFYLDLLESLKLQDRRGLPVFHRELWKPLVIRYSGRNHAQENILRLGGGATLGPQEEGSKYGEGAELHVGSLAGLAGYVTYPVEGDITAIVSGISNNVLRPTVTYKVSQDFPGDGESVVYMNGTLIFPEDKDPFAKGSGFEVYDVVDDVRDSDKADRETVLWASDALVDRSYVADHMSYALGITCQSTDVAKRILNAGWDSMNCGLTPELLRTLLAAILNVPVIQEAEETVRTVTTEADGTKRVATDKNTYTVYKGAKLRDCVVQGAVLHRGDLLDQALKIYPLLTDLSEEKLANTTEYADILRTDVPVLTVPRTLLRMRTANGLAVDWTPADVLWHDGDLDANGHRKLYFRVTGPEDDVSAFWEDVWAQAERDGVDLDEVFSECEPEGSSSDEPWQIVPAEFFLRNMLGGNTLIVTMDRSQVEDSSLIRDQMFFNIVNSVVPSGMRLFFVEHVSMGDGHDVYSMDAVDEDGGEYAMGAEDEAEIFAQDDAEDEYDEFAYGSLPGMKGKRVPTYEDQIELKFFRNRKRNAE